jgi:hypothetical protein
LGRRLPNVPRKILPRLDRRSPLPMIDLRKNRAQFTDRTLTTIRQGEPLEFLEPRSGGISPFPGD